jgi:ATP-binding cassette subfamily B protein
MSAFTVLALGVSLKYFTNQGLSGIIFLKQSILYFTILLFVLSISSAGRSFMIDLLCNKVCSDIRQDLYNKTLQLQAEILESNNLGNINSKIINDVSVIQTVIPTVFSFFIRNLLMLIGGIILLFITNAQLTIITIILVPVALLPLLMIGKKLKGLSVRSQATTGLLANKLDETIGAIKEIQANCQENTEKSTFSKILSIFIKQITTQLLIRSAFVGSVILIVSYVIIAIFWIGSNQVILAKIQTGDLVSFVFYAIVVASSLAGMSEVYTEINKAAAAADSIYGILNLEIDKKKPYKRIPSFNIDFQNVSFCYQNRKNAVLTNFNFSIKEGEKIAIIGPSGIGKTTILELLLKFYKPTTGSILIGDNDIQNLDTTQIRQLISYVAQDPYIFEATLKENLEYGGTKISAKEVNAAISSVNLESLVHSLPQGLNTVLNKNATTLSGGQKHRIALARALLRKSKILLLDEVTTGLDNKNEAIVCNLIKQEKRTVILVTHKQALIDICDRVVKLKS